MATITRQVRDIHQAFHYREMDVIKAMLTETPTLVDAVDAGGRTLLHRAVWWGEIDLVALLLEHGARADIPNANGYTAINIAWDVPNKNAHGQQLLRLIAAHGANAFLPARQFGCLACLAIQQNDAALVRTIFTNNPDQVNCTSCNNQYPLHLAVKCGHTETVRVLCQECGADPDIRGEHDITALHYIQKDTPLDLVRVLLESGANVNATDANGETPLHMVVEKDGSLDVARLLLDARAAIDSYSHAYFMPLHIATLQADGKYVAFLLDAGADIEAQGTPCDTPLMFAARVGHNTPVRLLLERGANVHVSDENGNTALHRAALNGSVDVLTMLLDAGADPDASNHVGITPIEVAVKSFNRQASVLLTARSSRHELRQLAQRGWDYLSDCIRKERKDYWHYLERQQGYNLIEYLSIVRFNYAQDKMTQVSASA